MRTPSEQIAWDAVIRQDKQRCRRKCVIRKPTASCEPSLPTHMELSSEAVHYALVLLFRDSGTRLHFCCVYERQRLYSIDAQTNRDGP